MAGSQGRAGAIKSVFGDDPADAVRVGTRRGLTVAVGRRIEPRAAADARVRVRLSADGDLAEIRAPGAADIRFGDREVEFSLPRSDEPTSIAALRALAGTARTL